MMSFGALDSFALDSLPQSGPTTFVVSISELTAATDVVSFTFDPVSQPGRPIRDYWDCDGWGRIIPGSCIRR